MNKFIVFTFFVLSVGFYELSGGADFVPEIRETSAPQVARAQQLETVAASLVEPAKVSEITKPTETAAVQLASFRSDTPLAEFPKIDLSKFNAPVPAEEAVAVVASTEFVGTDIRQVTGNRVNMRAGPGTNYAVVAQLIRGDEAEVLIDDGTGWVQLRLQGGQTGWMADFLLSD